MGKGRKLITKGEVIRRAREAAGLTEKELAAKIGVSVGTIYNHERYTNHKKIDEKTINKLMNVIDVKTLFNRIEVAKIKTKVQLVNAIKEADDLFGKDEKGFIAALTSKLNEKDYMYYE